MANYQKINVFVVSPPPVHFHRYNNKLRGVLTENVSMSYTQAQVAFYKLILDWHHAVKQNVELQIIDLTRHFLNSKKGAQVSHYVWEGKTYKEGLLEDGYFL